MGAVEKVPLFARKTEWLAFSLLLLLLFSLNLLYHYRDYRQFSDTPFLRLDATVLSQYVKYNTKNRPYTVLKLQSGSLIFYTTTREDLKPLKNRALSLTIVTKKIPFHRYLGTFYAPSFNLGLLPEETTFRTAVQRWIAGQHDAPLAADLYSTLFLAEAVGKKLREAVSDFGISHLIALSGYHLGFLGAIIWLLFNPLYTFFQQRFFPYRNRHADLGLLAAGLLLGYMLFVGTPPSLLRAYGMLAVGLFLFHRWIDLLSFATLAVTVGLLIAFAPWLLFSIGFWFSVVGVFYIYLFLHYFRGLRPLVLVPLLNLFIFAAMLPVVHVLFEKFTFFQLLSPLLSLLFALFYPVAILLHLLGLGYLLDPFLLRLFDTEMIRFELSVSLPFLGFYLLASFLAVFHRRYLPAYLASLGGFVLLATWQVMSNV